MYRINTKVNCCIPSCDLKQSLLTEMIISYTSPLGATIAKMLIYLLEMYQRAIKELKAGVSITYNAKNSVVGSTLRYMNKFELLNRFVLPCCLFIFI